jgi:hypothetical protein
MKMMHIWLLFTLKAYGFKGSEVHPASYPMRTGGSFHGGKAAEA